MSLFGGTTGDGFDEGFDPALAAAVLEIEEHAAGSDWGQPAQLYALIETAQLVAEEPALARLMGLDAAAVGSLTPVEQELVAGELEDALAAISWPADVAGCAAVVERLVLPTSAVLPEDPDEAEQYAAAHPDRQEMRIVAGATRAGATYCALRSRAHDDPSSVMAGTDLVPQLLELLTASLEADE